MLHEVRRDYKWLQGVTRGYRGLQEAKGLQGVTRGNMK